MSYSVTCECGASAPVVASQAGTALPCRCGRKIGVPALSVLRATAAAAYVPNDAIERIRVLIARGELPANTMCPITGLPANCTVNFHIQCEEPWARREGAGGQLAMWLVLGGWGALLWSLNQKTPEVLGNDVSLKAPMRFSSQALPWLERRRRQRPLRKLLSQTPAYRQLFRDYPRALITVCRPLAEA